MTALPEFLCGGLFVAIFAVLIHRRIVNAVRRELERQRRIGAELHRDLMEEKRERLRADWWKTN